MKKIYSFILNIFVNSIGIYAVGFTNEFLFNAYVALTVIVFCLSGMTVFAIFFLETLPSLREHLLKVASQKELPFILQIIQTICDITLIFVLFGFKHWWLGAMWFCIHILFSHFFKDTIRTLRHEMKEP